MQHFTKISLLATLLVSLSSAGGNETQVEIESIETVPTTMFIDRLFEPYSLGISHIILGDTDYNALHLSSKIGYMFDNDISVYMLGSSNFYKRNGDYNDMGLITLGTGYDIPFTSNKLVISAAAGLGSNFNYNRIFKDFSESYDFGFAYQADVSYNFNEKWSLTASYSKFNFNTNKTQLEDPKAKIISLSVDYKLDTSLFLY